MPSSSARGGLRGLAGWAACGLLLAGWVTAAAAQEPGRLELSLPRPPGADEAVWLRIRAGPLPPGARLRVRGGDGEPFGTVSPFGMPRGQVADYTDYTVPLPKHAIADGRVALRLEVEEPGAAVRAPRPGEVQAAELVYVPVTR